MFHFNAFDSSCMLGSYLRQYMICHLAEHTQLYDKHLVKFAGFTVYCDRIRKVH